jgi:uncharacterized repeat protein (TIGR03803 family)
MCTDGCGTVFKLTPGASGKWVYSVIYRFRGKNDGSYPLGPVVFDADGNMYGTAGAGLTNGIVFELVRSSSGWTGKTVYSFGSTAITDDLIIDSAGNLYGNLWQLGIFQLVHRSDGKWTENTLCNCQASGAPALDQAGNLYVYTNTQLLQLERSRHWAAKAIAVFNGRNGEYPVGSVIFDESGNLYGATSLGGKLGFCVNYDGCGTVFKLTRGTNGKWQHTVLYKFKGIPDGDFPRAGVILDQGNLYGTTQFGGNISCNFSSDLQGCGTVFELAPANDGHWKHTVIDRFGVGDGGGPPSGLIADAHGNFYGTMAQQFNGGCGMVYELSPSADSRWKERILYQFGCGNGDGTEPGASLIFDSTGNLYGTTIYGGAHDAGTVFKLTSGSGGVWTESLLYSFTGNADGASPAAALVLNSAGNLYGTTEYGGSGGCWDQNGYPIGCGVVFELMPTAQGWKEAVLHSFAAGPNDGAFPAGALVLDQAGNLYGTTTVGGNGAACYYDNNPGCGTFFRLSPGKGGAWTETLLYDFTEYRADPTNITMDSQGNFYGVTYADGTSAYCQYGCGTVYELSPFHSGPWTERVLYNFGGFEEDGMYPLGPVTFDKSGVLYGTTSLGGSSSACDNAYGGCGIVFQLSPSASGGWTEKVVHSFTGPYKDGATPGTGVILDSAGNLFGTTNNGGLDDNFAYTFGGTVFEITP